ncbi:MAG: sterol desaturase family protein [Deltaproteobacteria bacterium]|nr:sterol desaturase family protein [Deltaproteobacteria bacterium]MBW2446609.1 sterol desaturase family protein [Deltaproteobacteria bacterium]
MTEVEFQIIKGVGFVLALMLAIGLQWLRPHTAVAGSWRVNASLWAANAAFVGVVCGACACTVSRWAGAEGIGLLNLGGASPWLAIPVSILGLDLVSYAWHRANHVVPFLWRFHQVHHSDPDFTASTSLRLHPGEILLSLPLRLIAVAGIGVPIVGVIVFEVCFAFQNWFEHGNIDLPARFERQWAWLFVTPALHRRHHSRRHAELNSNYGTIFTLWDRRLGTFGPSSSSVSVRTGLPGAEQALGPAAALTLPFRTRLRGE